ncbi:MAG TPA: thioredoxin family protein, partial [Kineosporiaceae bacterium]|nr:thioredoxin family protein [Kineosporiaceae bacterium]
PSLNGGTQASEARTAPDFQGIDTWLNSQPLKAEQLRGKVVLVDFWTYTCINWLRQLPYLRAWAAKYGSQGLVVIGVHTPEFPFEHDADNVRRSIKDFRIEYPVATDNDYAVWEAFDNYFWPALYFADAEGRIRHHHFGEGEYRQSEMVIQQLLTDAGAEPGRDLVSPELRGFEVGADWDSLRTPETYTGYDRTGRFASPGGLRPGARQLYGAPDRLPLNEWALAGDWTAGERATTAEAAGGQVLYRFQARDVNVVMGTSAEGTPVRYQVRLDGQPPGPAHGFDVDAQGNGTVAEPRLYQLVRQPGPVAERTLEITFLDPGAQVYAFTFG